jgi:hypothetical protein
LPRAATTSANPSLGTSPHRAMKQPQRPMYFLSLSLSLSLSLYNMCPL